MALLNIIPPTLPEGFCNTLTEDWPQELINKMGEAVAVFDGVGTITMNQVTVPDADQRDFLWFNPNTGRTYFYNTSQGAWLSPHPYPAGGSLRQMWVGTEAALWGFDGGDGSNPTTVPPAGHAGAMWIVDPAFAGRSPMGVGAIPGTVPAKSLALIEDYGAGSHAQTIAEMPAHSHSVLGAASDSGSGHPVFGTGSDDSLIFATEPAGSSTAMSMVPPVRGVYIIMRSNRINYLGS